MMDALVPCVSVDDVLGAPGLVLTGPVTVGTLREVRTLLDGTAAGTRVNLSAVTKIDTAGAWALVSWGGSAMHGASPAQRLLLQTVEQALPNERTTIHESPASPCGIFWLALVRRRAGGGCAGRGNGFPWPCRSAVGRNNRAPAPAEADGTCPSHAGGRVGCRAIVALMGFLIGVVLAFQGAAQLRQFGAEVFVVDLIAVSILRELGMLLTAIIVAGRSASAFTAAIGSMNIREEIDAIRVLGLDPIELLVLPRLLALVIVLPVLGLVADLAGLFGGGLMAWIELGISPVSSRANCSPASAALRCWSVCPRRLSLRRSSRWSGVSRACWSRATPSRWASAPRAPWSSRSSL